MYQMENLRVVFLPDGKASTEMRQKYIGRCKFYFPLSLWPPSGQHQMGFKQSDIGDFIMSRQILLLTYIELPNHSPSLTKHTSMRAPFHCIIHNSSLITSGA